MNPLNPTDPSTAFNTMMKNWEKTHQDGKMKEVPVAPQPNFNPIQKQEQQVNLMGLWMFLLLIILAIVLLSILRKKNKNDKN